MCVCMCVCACVCVCGREGRGGDMGDSGERVQLPKAHLSEELTSDPLPRNTGTYVHMSL